MTVITRTSIRRNREKRKGTESWTGIGTMTTEVEAGIDKAGNEKP